jgi:hypothetical protein
MIAILGRFTLHDIRIDEALVPISPLSRVQLGKTVSPGLHALVVKDLKMETPAHSAKASRQEQRY